MSMIVASARSFFTTCLPAGRTSVPAFAGAILRFRNANGSKTQSSPIARFYSQQPKHTMRVGIVGAGGVGSAIASSLINKNIVSGLYLSDINSAVCDGVAMDLQDEAFQTGTLIESQPIHQLRDCEVVIITSGAKQLPGEPRTNLIKRNAKIMKSILDSMFPLRSNTKIVVVSNPVDILSSLAQHWCAPYIPKEQVIGSGTYLDSQRLRVALAKRLGVSIKSIHGYVLGEHGDSQVVARSATTIGGCPIDRYWNFTEEEYEAVETEVRNKAYEIIQRKGATSHGIGACVAAITECILLDKREVIPVSHFQPGYGTYLGWPSVLGASGVHYSVPLKLNDEEERKLQRSAHLIKQICDEILSNPLNEC
eukprot:Colp12_sorted_trinity150504_noHs@23345